MREDRLSRIENRGILMGMQGQPSGTVTLVFTDIERSTQLLAELGTEIYRRTLGRHRAALRETFGCHDGYEVDYEGDAFFYAFQSARAAVSAVREAMAGMAGGSMQMRVGIHTGEPGLDPPKYVGMDVHRAARIMASAHGGQVVLSQSTLDLLEEQADLRDLGEHRLKDLNAPIRLYQVGEGDFPPLRSLYRTNLPVAPTSFLGRERELVEVVSLLEADDVRLITLTGVAGTGKTRLAVQAAAEAGEQFPDGVWWVPLAPLRDSGLLLSTIARSLGLRGEPGRPLGETLPVWLEGKATLLILDNVEQLLPDAVDSIARLRDLGSPTILLTSRERLRLAGERAYPVPPLETATSVELFRLRAADAGERVGAGPTVRELCERLDNLPLAIELAAARTPLFGPEQLLQRIGQRLDLLAGGGSTDRRHRALRSTIDWSYELLSRDEQRVFRALGSFAGGSTFEAAAAVATCGADTLQSLIDKSLVRRRDRESRPRYLMLETVREYALERLRALGEEDEVRSRHGRYFLDLAERAEAQWAGPGQAESFDQLEQEHDNLRAALAFFRGAADLELRLSVALRHFWLIYGHLDEGRRALASALAAAPNADLQLRVHALSGAGELAGEQGDFEAAGASFEAMLELSRSLGDHARIAGALANLGNLALYSGDLGKARLLYEGSIAEASVGGAMRTEHVARENLGVVALNEGDLETAVALLEESAALAQRDHDEQTRGTSTRYLAAASLECGDHAWARQLLLESLTLAGRLGEVNGIAHCLDTIAGLAAAEGEPEEAALYFGAADLARVSIGALRPPDQQLLYERWLAQTLSQLDAATYATFYESGRLLDPDDAYERALAAVSAERFGHVRH